MDDEGGEVGEMFGDMIECAEGVLMRFLLRKEGRRMSLKDGGIFPDGRTSVRSARETERERL